MNGRGTCADIRNPSDRRKLLVEVTDPGRKVAHTFRPIVHDQEKRWLEILSDDEQQRLIDLLHQLQANLLDSDA